MYACIMCGVHELRCAHDCKQVMYECNRSRSEVLAEAVPEAMKNVLLVMATRGLLSPAWTVSGLFPDRSFLGPTSEACCHCFGAPAGNLLTWGLCLRAQPGTSYTVQGVFRIVGFVHSLTMLMP